ncbi:hypothetical protein Lfu02_59120 [Longispora fulva]|uniref:Uncharacterized protein n=1 Tax=Longispora fulva TaxID=619741 RepID=A0A8J7KKT4_9ACTN|nr:hypothetical protein [Longispora fulva]MBG6137106.1 hypothetical protein [Longispora fulva]GIG61540.1 hypothetical protein Lfu02_59120 [Longispora fulva]
MRIRRLCAAVLVALGIAATAATAVAVTDHPVVVVADGTAQTDDFMPYD